MLSKASVQIIVRAVRNLLGLLLLAVGMVVLVRLCFVLSILGGFYFANPAPLNRASTIATMDAITQLNLVYGNEVEVALLEYYFARGEEYLDAEVKELQIYHYTNEAFEVYAAVQTAGVSWGGFCGIYTFHKRNDAWQLAQFLIMDSTSDDWRRDWYNLYEHGGYRGISEQPQDWKPCEWSIWYEYSCIP